MRYARAAAANGALAALAPATNTCDDMACRAPDIAWRTFLAAASLSVSRCGGRGRGEGGGGGKQGAFVRQTSSWRYPLLQLSSR